MNTRIYLGMSSSNGESVGHGQTFWRLGDFVDVVAAKGKGISII